MTRAVPIVVLLILFAAVACDVNYNGYSYDHPKEDWKSFDYVFQGASPDADGNDMFVKLNQFDDAVFTGETTGVFFSKFDGGVLHGELVFEGTFTDQRCPDPGHMLFHGVIEDDVLQGIWTVRACERYDFYYEGDLVGGRLKE